MDLRGSCSIPERAVTRAMVSREEQDGTSLRNTEEVESADLVIQWLQEVRQKDGLKIPLCFSIF